MRPSPLPNLSRHAVWHADHRPAFEPAHVITLVTAARRRWFAHVWVATAVARELGKTALWREHCAHAWVLMPDRACLLITPGGSEGLAALMARIRSVTDHAARAVTTSARPLWADGFHDRVLRVDERVADAAHSLIATPVRAGIVDSLWVWPFWDSRWLPEPGDDECDVVRGCRQ